jgi:F0F1-type ATP synthase membrane subunit b/b'
MTTPDFWILIAFLGCCAISIFFFRTQILHIIESYQADVEESLLKHKRALKEARLTLEHAEARHNDLNTHLSKLRLLYSDRLELFKNESQQKLLSAHERFALKKQSTIHQLEAQFATKFGQAIVSFVVDCMEGQMKAIISHQDQEKIAEQQFESILKLPFPGHFSTR